jgi:hypothetical protein
VPDGARWGIADEVLVPRPARPLLGPVEPPPDPAALELAGLGADLSPAEVSALVVLARGGTVGEAARAAGVHRNTVARWARPGEALALALDELRRERLAAARLRLVAAAGAAADVLADLALDPAAPPAVRLRAACALLDRVGLGPAVEPPPPAVVEPTAEGIVEGLSAVLARAARVVHKHELDLDGCQDDAPAGCPFPVRLVTG